MDCLSLFLFGQRKEYCFVCNYVLLVCLFRFTFSVFGVNSDAIVLTKWRHRIQNTYPNSSSSNTHPPSRSVAMFWHYWRFNLQKPWEDLHMFSAHNRWVQSLYCWYFQCSFCFWYLCLRKHNRWVQSSYCWCFQCSFWYLCLRKHKIDREHCVLASSFQSKWTERCPFEGWMCCMRLSIDSWSFYWLLFDTDLFSRPNKSGGWLAIGVGMLWWQARDVDECSMFNDAAIY